MFRLTIKIKHVTMSYSILIKKRQYFCPISFGHYIVCYFSIDLRLLVTSLVSSDVSYLTC
jgi:hypothetical protein